MIKASAGIYADESGPEMARLVSTMPHMTPASPWPCSVEVVVTAVVPDDAGGHISDLEILMLDRLIN